MLKFQELQDRFSLLKPPSILPVQFGRPLRSLGTGVSTEVMHRVEGLRRLRQEEDGQRPTVQLRRGAHLFDHRLGPTVLPLATRESGSASLRAAFTGVSPAVVLA